MRESQTDTIGDFVFTVHMMPPMQAHKALLRLARLAGPVLGPLLASEGTVRGVVEHLKATTVSSLLDKPAPSDDGIGSGFGWIDEALRRASTELNDEFFDFVIPLLQKATDVEPRPASGKSILTEKKCLGDSGVFDVVFAGQMTLMYKWLWFAWRAQYKDFFDFFPKLEKIPTIRNSSIEPTPPSQAQA